MHGLLNVKLKFMSSILKNRELLFYSYLYWITTNYAATLIRILILLLLLSIVLSLGLGTIVFDILFPLLCVTNFLLPPLV